MWAPSFIFLQRNQWIKSSRSKHVNKNPPNKGPSLDPESKFLLKPVFNQWKIKFNSRTTYSMCIYQCQEHLHPKTNGKAGSVLTFQSWEHWEPELASGRSRIHTQVSLFRPQSHWLAHSPPNPLRTKMNHTEFHCNIQNATPPPTPLV